MVSCFYVCVCLSLSVFYRLFLWVPSVGLLYVIVAFPGHTCFFVLYCYSIFTFFNPILPSVVFFWEASAKNVEPDYVKKHPCV